MDQQKKKAIEDQLAKIAADNAGRLTPNAVVADAENPESPLHDQFEWNNEVAGPLYRLAQARELIRTVKVMVSVLERTFATPRYARDPRLGSDQQGYIEVTTARTEADVARDMMRNELGRICAAIERARGISVILGLENEFETLLAAATSINEKLAA